MAEAGEGLSQKGSVAESDAVWLCGFEGLYRSGRGKVESLA